MENKFLQNTHTRVTNHSIPAPAPAPAPASAPASASASAAKKATDFLEQSNLMISPPSISYICKPKRYKENGKINFPIRKCAPYVYENGINVYCTANDFLVILDAHLYEPDSITVVATDRHVSVYANERRLNFTDCSNKSIKKHIAIRHILPTSVSIALTDSGCLLVQGKIRNLATLDQQASSNLDNTMTFGDATATQQLRTTDTKKNITRQRVKPLALLQTSF
uniref:SHSP domain-containing protein n=1 Tax=Syphacia muris TaxID=451379 RepID=A0A0N5AMI2_9BILA